MRSISWSLVVSFLLVFALTAAANILEVPSAYPTIQSALDLVDVDDTIRVAPGTYHEFLRGPDHLLTLTGWYPADTTAALRTLLDPIPSGADTPSVAVFRGEATRIENFAFYNRPELRQPGNATRTGGIECEGDELWISHCRFDTVSKAVNGGNLIVARNCTFTSCISQCIRPATFGAVDAEECSFSGGETVWLVRCYSGSSIRNCTFLCSENHTDLLAFAGENIEVVGCTFGPCYSAFPIVRAYTQGNCLIDSCVFAGIERASSIVEVSMECPGPIERPITIRNCVFTDYHAVAPAQGTTAIRLVCQDNEPGMFGKIENSTFENGESIVEDYAGIFIRGSVYLSGNTFENIRPESVPDVYASQTSFDTVTARDNQFLPPGVAAAALSPFFDARENWWGDSTGPFHPSLNPNGMGTEVGNGVLFEPWLTSSPDSLPDTSGNSTTVPIELPNELTLSVYPNPFNPVTTISFTTQMTTNVQLVLFDLLGREVAGLADDVYLAGNHYIEFDGRNLASGVYVARLHAQHSSAATKLLLIR